MLAVLIGFAPSFLLAQTIAASIVDPVSKDTALITSTEQLFGKPSMSGTNNVQLFFNFSRLRKHQVLTLYFQSDKTLLFTIMPQDSVQIVLKDSTYIVLKTTRPVKSKYGIRDNGNTITLTYFLPVDKYNALLSNIITLVSIHFEGGSFDLNVPGERALKFQRAATLMRNRM
jgi:hypothetical protein